MRKLTNLLVLLLIVAMTFISCNTSVDPNSDTISDTSPTTNSNIDTSTTTNSNTTPEPQLSADEILLLSLKSDLKSAMTENTQDYKVIFCDDTNKPTLADGEKAIWVDELFDAYPNSADAAEASITAVYIYYPMHNDPSQYNDSELMSMGATRIFAYLGIPDGATAQNKAKGIVCTHGGEGHAYAKYCLEAVRHGYAAIAFDTEGYHATSGTHANILDLLGHKEKDYFTTSRSAITEQWLYYVISDCAFANTVLRSLDNVDESKVGITGISWGGLSVTLASCYDSRFAFCVPMYISYFSSKNTNAGKFASDSYNPGFDEFCTALWQDAETLEGNKVPTLIINSQNDTWADISCTMMTYDTLKKNNNNVYLLIKPNLPHSQEAGASQPEIYRFADFVCSGYGDEKSFYTTDKEITNSLGRSYELKVTVPQNITDVTATLYYTKSAISYSKNFVAEPTFNNVTLTKSGTVGTDDNGNSVYTFTVTVPEDAYLYYISFTGSSAYDNSITSPYTYQGNQIFHGKIFGSSSIVVLDGGSINK